MIDWWDNESARVPLAVIGVLFVLISTVISINLSRNDSQMATAMLAGKQADTAGTALLYAQADLARAVNYAGMEALKQLGETPVIQPDNTSQYNPVDGYVSNQVHVEYDRYNSPLPTPTSWTNNTQAPAPPTLTLHPQTSLPPKAHQGSGCWRH